VKALFAAIALIASSFQASAATCTASETEEMLGGAAKERKLAGAASTSFVKKCVADAPGS